MSKSLFYLIIVMAVACSAWAEDAAFPDDVHSLMSAAFEGRTDDVKRMLDKGVDVNSRYLDRETPLIFAALNGHTPVVKLLLSRGADVNARDEWGKTALRYAEEKGHAHVIEILRKYGAKNRPDKNTVPPEVGGGRKGGAASTRTDKRADTHNGDACLRKGV